jgi:hypothetical protein
MVLLFDSVTESYSAGEIPWSLTLKGFRNLKKLKSSSEVVERNSDLPYPDIQVVPTLRLLLHEDDIQAVVHAHTDFLERKRRLRPVVTVTLPFLCFAGKAMYTAVLGHEFLHYLHIAKVLVKSGPFGLGQEFGGTVLGRLVFDEAAGLEAGAVYEGSYLVSLVEKRFPEMMRDSEFLGEIRERWMDEGLPMISISSQDLTARFSAQELMSLHFPGDVLDRVSEIDEGEEFG